MHHSFIDRYSHLDSMLHRLDPRTKIIACLSFVLSVVLTPPHQAFQFAGYGAVIAFLIVVSSVPPAYVVKRSLTVLPFVLVVSICTALGRNGAGRWMVWGLLAKAWLAALFVILLSSTTGFADMLKGLERLRVPPVFIMVLSFMYRYIFILGDEAMRMERARQLRSFGNTRGQIRVFGNMVGSLFVRAFERGERVYQSMLARGFDGEIRTLSPCAFAARDFLFLALVAVVLGAIKLW